MITVESSYMAFLSAIRLEPRQIILGWNGSMIRLSLMEFKVFIIKYSNQQDMSAFLLSGLICIYGLFPLDKSRVAFLLYIFMMH